MVKSPNILLTGVNGVGKSTILNLFPGEIVLEIDDNFNEIIQKSIVVDNFKKIDSCILREIDIRELIKNFNSYHNIITLIDIICLVTDSTERNILESQELLLKLREKVPDVKYFLIANFQDRKSISWNEDKIESNLKLKTFGFSAIQEESEQLINDIIKEILKLTFQNKKKEIKTILSLKEVNEIWAKIEKAMSIESKQDFKEAAKLFSEASTEIRKLNLEHDELEALYYLCQAWQSLALGHLNKNIQKFAEAEIIFNQANEYLKNKNLKNLVYANSIFCEILKLTTQFDELDNPDREQVFYPKIHKLIKSAIEFYNDGGFVKEVEWAKSVLSTLNI